MLEILLSFELLTCSEYDFLMEGLIKTDLPKEQKREIQVEFVSWTEPMCFETEDAND